MSMPAARPHATTIVAVKRGGQVAIAGDGQVTVGDVVMKNSATKVRRIYRDEIVVGFAGAVADAFTLFDKFEQHLDKHQGNLLRASVELGKEWRTDKYLRHLDAMLRRRVHPLRQVRAAAREAPGEPASRRRRAQPGVADRPLPPPPRGHAAGGQRHSAAPSQWRW